MKKIFILITILSSIVLKGFAQTANKKIYYLADTVTITKTDRTVKIETVSFFEHHFTFFCKCIPPYKKYVDLVYVEKKGEPKAEIVSKKTSHPYISFKELMDLSAEYHKSVAEIYDIYITEVLPGNKFRTNKVKFTLDRSPSDDGVIVKEKQ